MFTAVVFINHEPSTVLKEPRIDTSWAFLKKVLRQLGNCIRLDQSFALSAARAYLKTPWHWLEENASQHDGLITLLNGTDGGSSRTDMEYA